MELIYVYVTLAVSANEVKARRCKHSSVYVRVCVCVSKYGVKCVNRNVWVVGRIVRMMAVDKYSTEISNHSILE